MSIPLCSHYQHGIPLNDRAETVLVVNTLLGAATVAETCIDETNRSGTSNDVDLHSDESSVYGEGPLILSDIPKSSRGRPIVLGIDEAGRGSVVGPMIYGMCYWNANANTDDCESTCRVEIPKDFNDSKQLNEAQRNVLFDTILDSNDIGFGIRIFPASEISRNMLRPLPYNLNQMSHNAAISIIRSLQQTNQVQIQTCFIDTVGNASSYQRRLEQEFPGIEFVVESKADDTYPPCSAASIVAKVVRDRMITNGKFSEMPLNRRNHTMKFGSGYPSDPICKEWIHNDGMIDPIFTFPNIVRFSWAPIKKILLQKPSSEQSGDTTGTPPNVVPIVFAADTNNEEDDNDSEKHKIMIGMKRQQEQMSIFLGKSKDSKGESMLFQKRSPYFERRKLRPVLKL